MEMEMKMFLSNDILLSAEFKNKSINKFREVYFLDILL